MRAETVACAAVAEALPRIVDGRRRGDRALARHAGQCLTCQAELARYRRMLRLLHQLRDQRAALPAGALQQLVSGMELRAGHHLALAALVPRRRGPGLVGAALAAGALVVAGGAAVVGSRSAPGAHAGSRWPSTVVRGVLDLATTARAPAQPLPVGSSLC